MGFDVECRFQLVGGFWFIWYSTMVGWSIAFEKFLDDERVPRDGIPSVISAVQTYFGRFKFIPSFSHHPTILSSLLLSVKSELSKTYLND